MTFDQRHLSRREALIAALAAGATVSFSGSVFAQAKPIGFMTAGKGSAFLPYGEGLGKFLANSKAPINVLESAGSNENLTAVNNDPSMTGMAFLGSAAAAVAGTGAFAGKATPNVRALFPTYNTSFQIAALKSKNITKVADLDGKKVGVGPEKGPAENFFRALVEVAGIKPEIINGTPADLAAKAASGELDALWQGAIAPIPALVDVQNKGDAIVFGLTQAEVDGMLKKMPYLAADRIPAGTYKGQTAEILSVAGWNVVIAHKDMPDAVAYELTKAALSAKDPAKEIHPFAAGTRAANAGSNKVVPYHPGAIKALKELGASI